MKASTTLFAVASALALASSVLGAKCGENSCSQDTPCCVKGYCNRNAMYCAPFSCEPGNSFAAESCWNTAHCVDHMADFTQPAASGAFAQIADYKGQPDMGKYVSKFEPSNAHLANSQLELTLVKQPDNKGFGAVVTSTRAIQYGTVTAVLKSASTAGGVVSSMIIRDDRVGDEIDFEFVGSERGSVQSNYYWRDELDYTKMIRSQDLPDTTQNYHTYQIVWTPDSITWIVNGAPFRTVTRAETWDAAANTFKYPDSESYVSFSVWDGGSGAKGTSDWAGGLISWAAEPFIMGIKSVSV
ncbi:putative glycosidase CRH2, partial [Coemansia sp. BCRC 34301]